MTQVYGPPQLSYKEAPYPRLSTGEPDSDFGTSKPRIYCLGGA